jgi:hypothetical protein
LTQAEIDSGRVRYVHLDGEEVSDFFTVTVDDQTVQGNSTASRVIDISLIPVNDDPVIVRNTNAIITENDGDVTHNPVFSGTADLNTAFSVYEGNSLAIDENPSCCI